MGDKGGAQCMSGGGAGAPGSGTEPISAHAIREPGLVVIGNFDGVHLGHQTVIAQASARAAQLNLRPRVLTFSPHPAEVLGRQAPPKLTTLGRKRELIARVDPRVELVVMTFDLDFAAQSPEAFAERITHPPLSARSVIVGENFRFGKNRAGDFDRLIDLGRQLGFEAQVEELVGDDDGPWSSTRIRAALAEGDVLSAARMLGRPHMISGVVERGDQRGRTIGFPTANLGQIEEAMVAHGVYAVLVDRVDDDGAAHALAPGAANVGTRPTVGGTYVRLEVHLFDVDMDLYGQRLRCHFLERLRPEMRFGGLEELRARIERDAAEARAILADHRPNPTLGGAYA
jgi:riboflavin kinase / FMN adenylyltransferase